jgi:hypothetical protein
MQRIVTKDGNRPDKVVSEALTDLRESGLVPWGDIVDETREVFDYTGSSSVADDLARYLDQAVIDPWRGQVPFILTESRSLAGVLRAQCSDYRCRIASANGQVGGFLHTKVAPLLNEGDRIGYLGDYDLAGGDIEANTRRVLESIVGELDWQRLALTRDQVEQHNLPRIIKTDKRFKNGGGEHEAVETAGRIPDEPRWQRPDDAHPAIRALHGSGCGVEGSRHAAIWRLPLCRLS